jgi:hypothetical protein
MRTIDEKRKGIVSIAESYYERKRGGMNRKNE